MRGDTFSISFSDSGVKPEIYVDGALAISSDVNKLNYSSGFELSASLSVTIFSSKEGSSSSSSGLHRMLPI